MSKSQAKDKEGQKKSKTIKKADDFLVALVKAASPSGFEFEAQSVIDRYVEPVAEEYRRDALGNRIASINLKGKPRLMFAGHMDEIGFIVKHINKEGFIYFDAIGGHDVGLISGRKIKILTSKGGVSGITGRRAIHLLDAEERKKMPKLHSIWIDIGANSKEEALKKVAIGDPIVYEQEPFYLENRTFCARGLDDRAGCYAILEVLRRLSKEKLEACVTSVATTQEEIGTRGAIPSSYSVRPDVGIAVDVGHATDFPDGESNRLGEFKLGAGPILSRGPNIHPMVFERLKACAERLKISYQVEAAAGPTGTDARVIQMTRSGVATGLVSIPLRYMHTPNEMAHLTDIENVVQLLVEFARTLTASDRFEW